MKKEDNKDKIIAKTGVAAGTTMAGLGGAMSLGAKNQADLFKGKGKAKKVTPEQLRALRESIHGHSRDLVGEATEGKKLVVSKAIRNLDRTGKAVALASVPVLAAAGYKYHKSKKNDSTEK